MTHMQTAINVSEEQQQPGVTDGCGAADFYRVNYRSLVTLTFDHPTDK